MSQQSLSNGIFYIQTEFPQQSELRIRSLYGITAGEKLIAALWINKLSHKGFIVTDRTLFWNFDQTESIPSHSAVFKIETDETQPKLNINDSTFFLQKLTATQAQELCSFLSLTVEQDKAPEELPSVIKQLPLVTERDILDRAGLFFDSAFNLFSTKTDTTTNESETTKEKTETEESKSESKEEKNDKKSEPKNEMTYARRTILGFLDFVASIAFIAALIVALKPWLLQDNPSVISSRSLSSFLEALENIFLRRGFSSDYSDALQQLRNIVVFSLMGGYIILKALVIGFSKNGRLKIISALLVLLTLLSVVLVSDKFLLFVLFLLLLYICFEFSCGFPWKDISTRIRDIFIITIIAYLVVHIVRIGDIRASIMFILTELSLPIKSWL